MRDPSTTVSNQREEPPNDPLTRAQAEETAAYERFIKQPTEANGDAYDEAVRATDAAKHANEH